MSRVPGVFHHDFETGSTCDLRQTGAHRYAEDSETRVWMMSYRLDDGPVRRWHPGEAEPREFLDHVANGGMTGSHNSMFERVIWNVALRSRPEYAHWPELRVEQQDDTMARALACHLPPDLDNLGKVLGLPSVKDKEGHALMMRMARPRKIHVFDDSRIWPLGNPEWTQAQDGRIIQWWNTPENLAREGAYCDQDVVVESLVDGRLPPLSADERALWELDQKINDRGVALDVATIERAVAVKAVAMRRDSTKTSTAKLDKMLACICADGRARGLFAYHRALTGRWGGFSIQPQNLPRVDEEKELPLVLAAIDAMEMLA